MQPINSALQQGRKTTQRERLLAGMVAVANRHGYARANISAVIAQAGVSRPTFYDYFADKEDCFLAALADVHERLTADIRQAVESQAPEQATAASVGALVAFASSQPAPAHFLMSEALAGGPRALDARDEGIAEIAEIIEGSRLQAASSTGVPDVCPRVLIGGIYRLLCSRLHRGAPAWSEPLEDLQRWIKSYELPAGDRRWRTLQPGPPSPPSPFVEQAPLRAPSALPPGRPSVSKEEAAENRRLRILFAAAQLAESKGYNAATIADIVKLAGVDSRAFYASFADKQDVFMAVHELVFEQITAVAAVAFFAGTSWPERIWEAGRALTQMLQNNPTVAHSAFVEAQAVGPSALPRIEDSQVAFTIFLQEGYQHKPHHTPPPRLALEAIVTTIFEIVYGQARQGSSSELSGLLGHIVFLALAPFLGAAEANRFIDRQLRSRPGV